MVRQKDSIRVGVAQMCSGQDMERNLNHMEMLIFEAVKAKCDLICLPEMAYGLGIRSVDGFRDTITRLAEAAKRAEIHVVPGTLREPSADKHFNTVPWINETGHVVTRYRKQHLFRATLAGQNYDESEYAQAGTETVVTDFLGWKVGLAICFDIRFPEMFIDMSRQQVEAIVVPSAFTEVSGAAHWDVLTRARALDTQAYIIAPAQTGTTGDGKKKYGHSRIVSPWGEVLCEMASGEGLIWADLEKASIRAAHEKIQVAASRNT